MSVGRAEVVVFPRIAGIVVEHCRKCTVGRRRASLSSWAPSLAPRRLCQSSRSVPAVVMAWDGPGPPGRGASVRTRRSGGAWKSRTPQEGGPGSRPRMQSAPLGRARAIARPFPQREVSSDG